MMRLFQVGASYENEAQIACRRVTRGKAIEIANEYGAAAECLCGLARAIGVPSECPSFLDQIAQLKKAEGKRD